MHQSRRTSSNGSHYQNQFMPTQLAHTVSQGTGHRFLSHHIQENEPEVTTTILEVDPQPPSPPKRSSSLLAATFNRHKRDVSVTLNPKRVSVATSTFWDGHPDVSLII